MYIITSFSHTKPKEGIMKDIYMLLGFGMGLVTGVLLYKYSQSTQKTVDKAEKTVVQEIDKAMEKTKKATDKAQKAIKKA